MSGQHRDVQPDDCRSCRTLYALLLADHEQPPAAPTTADQLSARSGLSRRAVRLHLTHLVTHQRIGQDRRTPTGLAVGGGQLPDDADALTWASAQEVPDATCRKCLEQYAKAAGAAWTGALGSAQLAVLLGVSERTARTHRAHLVAARLIRFAPDVLRLGEKGHRKRLPDRFTLLSGIVPVPAVDLVPGGDWLDDLAASMVVRLPHWFDQANRKEQELARVAIARRLRKGFTEDQLMTRLALEPDGPVTKPYGRLMTLLPGPDEVPVITAYEAVHGTQEQANCPGCERPFPKDQRTEPGELCRECRDATPEPEAVVDLAAVRHYVHALTA